MSLRHERYQHSPTRSRGRDERTGNLRRRSSQDGHEACGVDDTSAAVQSFALVLWIVAHSYNSVLASVPDSLEIDLHRQIPDLLVRVDCVVVFRMHDTGTTTTEPSKRDAMLRNATGAMHLLVEHDVEPSKLGHRLGYQRLDVGLLPNIGLDEG